MKQLLTFLFILSSFWVFSQSQYPHREKLFLEIHKFNLKNHLFEKKTSLVEANFQLSLYRKEWAGNIKWLSFPRLERYSYGNDAVDVKPILDRMYPSGAVFSLQREDLKKLVYNYGWPSQPLFENVQSTEGYKLEVTEWQSGKSPQWNFIDYQGGKLDPETPIEITGLSENWIGYFIEYPQKIEEALPPEVLNDVVYIIAQDWAMFNEGTPGNPDFTYQGKVRPLEWGDMVEIYTNSNHSFTWNQGSKKDPVAALKTEHYQYEEKLDYDPIFVLLDENSDVQEIAVKVNGEVKGAAVREEGDTLIQICAYLEGVAPDAQIDLETYSGGKSPVHFISDYLVKNKKTQKLEKRKLYAGEKALYQVLSINPKDQGELPDPMDQLSVYPIPANQMVHIDFLLNQESRIQMTIFNNLGQQIATPFQGSISKGYHNYEWNLKDTKGQRVPKGVYYYRIDFPKLGMQENGKIIVQ